MNEDCGLGGEIPNLLMGHHAEALDTAVPWGEAVRRHGGDEFNVFAIDQAAELDETTEAFDVARLADVQHIELRWLALSRLEGLVPMAAIDPVRQEKDSGMRHPGLHHDVNGIEHPQVSGGGEPTRKKRGEYRRALPEGVNGTRMLLRYNRRVQPRDLRG